MSGLLPWITSLPRRFLDWFAALTPKQKAWWIFVSVLVLFGTYGLGLATNFLLAFVVLGVAIVIAWKGFDEVLGRLLGASLFAAVGLAGFNVVVDHVLEIPIVLGLFVAVAVFAVVAAWYINLGGWPRGWTIAAAFALAVGMIVVVPWVVGHNAKRVASAKVEVARPFPTELDVMIVTDGTSHPLPAELPADDALREFAVRYSVGVAESGRVRWTLTDGKDATQALRVASAGAGAAEVDGEPPVRTNVDSALLLLVDGTAPVTDAPDALAPLAGARGEEKRWRNVARVATRTDVPTYALLQTRDPGRLRRWADFTTDGSAVSIQDLASPSVTDAGVRLGIAAPSSRGDYALAVQFRPILLFDSGEPVPRPLSIETLFAEDRVRLCHDDLPVKTACSEKPVTDAAKLVNGGTHLGLTLRPARALRDDAVREQARVRAQRTSGTETGVPPGTPPATNATEQPLGEGTAMYVNPVTRDGKLYLDYWWYLQDNPAETGAGAFCGAGLVIPGITCHNHQSDWEGLTVVVDRSGPEPAITEVHYAQHNKIVRYDWKRLRTEWDLPRYDRYVADVGDASLRPLAFSARGTHATYPAPCGHCPQEPKGIATIGENPHDGRLIWSGNDTSTCGADACLKLLPTRDRGHQPALWNDFAGPWGERNCRFRYYCDSGSPPAAPGHQGRFAEPWRTTVEGR